MSHDLAVPNPGVTITTMDELARVADMFAKSGMFNDARDAAQAGVRILAGQAWGIDPFTAMTAVQMIQNRPAMSAGVMAAKVKGHPKYDYVVKRLDNEACEIEFFQGDRSLGVSSFTLEDAKQAGYASKQNYKQTPRNMLFARALSNGVRWFTPDVFSASVYTPEDFMGESEGDLPEVHAEIRAPEKPVKAPEAKLEPPAPESAPEARAEAHSAPTGDHKRLLDALGKRFKALGLDRTKSLVFARHLTGRELDSAASMTMAEVEAITGLSDDELANALDKFTNPPPEEES